MLQIYLPIAGVSVDVILVLAIGGAVGFLSGMFGVGGGFLLTPLLIFLGIPPAVAVGTQVNQVVASSVSGAIAHWRRGNVDVAMGGILLAGGALGAGCGILLFRFLRAIGQIDLAIALCYIVFLSIVGLIMVIESVRAALRKPGAVPHRLHPRTLFHRLPFKMRFRKSRLYVSALLPLTIGFFSGVLAAIMGTGGGFFMVPAMIYFMGMPTLIVIGTSLFQIIFITIEATVLHAATTQSVDVLLALLLMTSGVVGAPLGTRAGSRLRAEELRGLLGILVLLIAGQVAYGLIVTPQDPFSVTLGAGGP